MKKSYLLLPLFGIVFFVIAMAGLSKGFAEPWIANRYAQNCAACHSPSRRNLKPSARRCTLACQACHVNPMGGGLRNQYGKWNQQRWLRSFATKYAPAIGHPKPAPLKKQKYGKQPIKTTRRLFKKYKKYSSKGLPLVETSNDTLSEKLFDRSDKQEQLTAKTSEEFLLRVTKEDPYRKRRSEWFTIGGDLRYFHIEFDGDDVSESKKSLSWPMGLDLGVQARPIRDYLSIVYEARFLNSLNGGFSELVENETITRSLYAMVDNLPYAHYVMAGTYRPQFGIYNPDHESIASRITGLGARARYNAVSFGGSPNVPFYNLTVFESTQEDGAPNDKGWTISLGGRFVTKGLSVQLSYWDSVGENDLGIELEKKMTSLSFGGQLGRTTASFEYIFIEKEFFAGASDSGIILSTDLKYRLYREIYLQALLTNSNIFYDFKEGDVVENTIGIKSFLIAGLELELNYGTIDTRSDTVHRKNNVIKAQAHLFF